MKKFRFEIIIFIIDAVCMILELVASRVMSPFFGNSNIVWTSIIGIILLSSSIGNFFGGKIADLDNKEKNLKFILFLSAIFIFIIPIIQDYTLIEISENIYNIKIGAIIATFNLFFLPSLLMGIVTPIILKLKLENLETAGKTAGRISAIGTLGGIFGTFLGGFFLVPNFGSVFILFILAIIIAILILLVDFKIIQKSTVLVIVITIISIIFFAKYSDENSINGKKILDGELGIYVSYDTQYGRVKIYNGKLEDTPVRILDIDSGYESATFTDADKVNELVFDYTKYYDLMFSTDKEINDTLLIGGAGYSYPKYYISHYQNKRMDVVEIDGEITDIAKKYFFLDKLIKDFDIINNKRLNLITEDGRVYLNKNNKKYDAILNDAFSGDIPAKTLTTIEAATKIKESLSEGGLYLTNIISSLEGKNSKFIKAEVNTLNQVFKNVYVIPCETKNETNKSRNNMIIASDNDYNFENTYDLKLENNEIVLKDDYCPVEALIPSR